MGWPTSTYLVPAKPQFAAGLYEETIADFTSRRSQDTVIRVDNAGLLFFQSANSGCTANGSLEPHLEGAFNVYDATLTIENCTDAYQSLNGVFEGLATRTIEDGWWDGWGDWLVIMLSTPSGAPAEAAITMWGSRI
jgi:hypothetical protein